MLRSDLGSGPALTAPLPLAIKKQFCERIRIVVELLCSSTATCLLPRKIFTTVHGLLERY